MKRAMSAFLALLLLASAALAEAPQGIVAKVVTPKGSLNLRAKPDPGAKILDTIPNGSCLLVTAEDDAWPQVEWNGQTGYCSASFLTLLRNADISLLNYRVLQPGDRGEDVIVLKSRLQELGYIRSGAELTDAYNDILKGRIALFQRQTGMTEDGIASQELQAYIFSDLAPSCTLTLPSVVSTRAKQADTDDQRRVICGCCWGEGCECCGGTGWIYY